MKHDSYMLFAFFSARITISLSSEKVNFSSRIESFRSSNLREYFAYVWQPGRNSRNRVFQKLHSGDSVNYTCLGAGCDQRMGGACNLLLQTTQQRQRMKEGISIYGMEKINCDTSKSHYQLQQNDQESKNTFFLDFR